jgi:hypothetical protein
MVRPASHIPSYRHHKPTNQADVSVRLPNGKTNDIYLGRHNPATSKAEYQRIFALLAGNGGELPWARPM